MYVFCMYQLHLFLLTVWPFRYRVRAEQLVPLASTIDKLFFHKVWEWLVGFSTFGIDMSTFFDDLKSGPSSLTSEFCNCCFRILYRTNSEEQEMFDKDIWDITRDMCTKFACHVLQSVNVVKISIYQE